MIKRRIAAIAFAVAAGGGAIGGTVAMTATAAPAVTAAHSAPAHIYEAAGPAHIYEA